MNIEPYVRFCMHHVWIENYYLNRDIWDHEIIFIEKVSLKFTIEGKVYIAKQNDLVLLRPGVHHIIEYNGEPCSQPHVHFDFYERDDSSLVTVSRVERSQMTKEELSYFREDFYKTNNINMPYIIHLKNPIEIKDLLFKIIDEFTYKNAYSSLVLKGLMIELIAAVLRENDQNNNSDLMTTRINELIVYMNANVDNNLSLDNLSDKMEVSKWKLIKKFNEYYHTTPINYYNKLRHLRAKDLLLNSFIPINKIAEMMNFDEPQTFSRWFKNVDGNYPSYYRKRKGQF